MAGLGWLRTGAITVTNGGRNVGGTDTIWGGGVVNPGDIILLPNGALGEVESVGSNTALTLKQAYAGATASAQPYAIIRMLPSGNVAADLAAALQALIQRYGITLDQLMEWLDSAGAVSFTDGTTTLAGLHGLRKLMADISQLFAESAKRPALTAAGSLGIGMAPNGWAAFGPGQNAIQTMSWSVSCDMNSHYQANNAFYSYTGSWTYIGSKCATRYDQDAAQGAHKWYSASAGVAGESITFSKLMELSLNGALAVAGPVSLGRYTTSTLPSAAAYLDHVITVSNASGGPALCLSNGSSWINIRTNAPVN